MTNPANIYILYGSKIILRKNILKKNKGDKTMKKVLLTSAVALAAFGAVQAVSAEDYTVDYNKQQQAEADAAAKKVAEKAAQKAAEITAALQPKNRAVLETYNKFQEAEKAYSTVEARLRAVQDELTKLYLASKTIADIEGDLTQFDKYLDASQKALQVAEKFVDGYAEYTDENGVTVPTTVKALEDVLKQKGDEKKAADKELAEADLDLTSARQAGQKDPAKLKALEDRFKEAEKKSKDAGKELATAEKRYKESVAKQDASIVEVAEITARIAAIQAKQSNDAVGYGRAVAGLDRKLNEKEAEKEKLIAEVGTARGTRDSAKVAFEAAEKAAKVAYAEYGLTYNLDSITASNDVPSQVKVGWVKDDKGQWSYVVNTKGQKATGWQLVDGAWYHFNAEGVMQKWWVKDGNTWYYLNGSGVMQTGWLQDGGKWYYLENSGAMKADQWFEVGGKWYYVDGSGALAVNTTVNGYTVNGNGEWV